METPHERVGIGPLHHVEKPCPLHQTRTLSLGEKRNRKGWIVGRWIRKSKHCFVYLLFLLQLTFKASLSFSGQECDVWSLELVLTWGCFRDHLGLGFKQGTEKSELGDWFHHEPSVPQHPFQGSETSGLVLDLEHGLEVSRAWCKS